MAYGLTKSAHLVDSSNQYFSVAGGSALAIGNNMTIEGWFYFPTVNSSLPTGFLVGKWADAVVANCSFYWLISTASSATILQFHCASGSSESDSPQVSWSPSANTWYHLAITFASGTVKFYVNGVQQGTDQTCNKSSFNTNSGTNTNIGTDRSSTAGNIDCNVSLVRIWSEARSAANLLANMCNVFGTATTNMAAEWSLDNVLTDASGNGLTLTNNNTATFETNTPSTCAVVGPANLKTRDGLASASIKTINGLAMASVKTLNGLA